MPFAVAIAAGLLGIAVGADIAGACTCADRDERDRLEAGEKAIMGRGAGLPDRPQIEPGRHRPRTPGGEASAAHAID